MNLQHVLKVSLVRNSFLVLIGNFLGPKDRRYRSNTPNFFFPKVEHYSDVSTATMIFLICGFGRFKFYAVNKVLL